MRIHNSSLTFSPIGLNQKAGRNNSAQNNEPSIATDAKNKPVNQPTSTEEIKKALASVSLTTDVTSNNIIKPTDSRTLRALSAYNREFNAPLQDQRTQLITGIDIYA